MISAVEIERKLWQIIDVLREKYALGESVDCVLKLLLFKRLSDQSCTEERTRLSVPEEARWSVIQRRRRALAQKLSEALTVIEETNSNLRGVFTNSEINFWTRFDDKTLLRIIKLFSELDLSNENFDDLNELGKAGENFIEKSAYLEGIAGIYTPHQLTQMMVKLINTQQETSIYDPACGSGEFLAEAVKFIKKIGGNLSQVNIYGQNTDIHKYATAKTNLILHGIDSPDIRIGNAILEPCFVKDGKARLFDVVLSNPPFNLKYLPMDLMQVNYPSRFSYGVPSNGIGDFLFIQHILSSLNNTGKAAVLLPRGVLFREGDEGEIRRKIIEADLIEAVIELAPKLFYYTSIPVVIMIFNRRKLNKNKILFIDASREYEAVKGHSLLHCKHIDHIVSTYRSFSDEEGFAKLETVEKIADNKYNLSVNCYVIPPANEKIDLTMEVSKLHKLEAERSELETKIDYYLRALGIKL
ncbi:N-6 DNA methylase [Nostoc sp.]|uniref:N-6 DNA methylase n=1 Tax=Nostoc sp. TaxID=1180 RepID=UPI002FF9C9C7